MALRKMTPDETGSYGVAALGDWLDEGVVEITGAVEKPGPDDAPSDLGFPGPLHVHLRGLRSPRPISNPGTAARSS